MEPAKGTVPTKNEMLHLVDTENRRGWRGENYDSVFEFAHSDQFLI